MHSDRWIWGAPLLCALLTACGATAGAGTDGGGHDGREACIVGDHKSGGHVDSHCAESDTYSVGGTVTGATGTLVLNNLDIDTLPVTDDGPFTFSVELADGAPYEVTITNHPSEHARVCTVTHGEGVIDGADVTDVEVVCEDAPADTPDDEVVDEGDDGTPTDDEVVDEGDGETPSDDEVVDGGDDETPTDDEVVDTPDETPDDEVVDTPTDLPKPGGPAWNAYVRADSGAPCDGTEPGAWGVCRHAGEMRDVAVTDRSGCDGLTAQDDLDAFDWTCEAHDGAAHMVTKALRPGKRLSDLVDFDAAAWRDNALHIFEGGVEIDATTPGAWWTNPVAAFGDGDLDAPGGVYLVDADTAAAVNVLADGVALVVAPGATLSGPGGSAPVVTARDRAFVWLEGRIDATGDGEGILVDGTRFSVLDDVKVQGAAHAGIHLLDARACRVTDAVAVQNDTYGLLLEGTGNLVRGLLAAGNALSGLHVIAGADNRMADVTAAGNGNWGVVLRATSGNVLMGVTTASQAAYGVWLDRSPGNSLMNIAALNNGTAGIYLFASDGAMLVNIAATDNGFGGLILNDSSYNLLTGRVLVGGNPRECLTTGGTAPGMETLTCKGTDGSDPEVTTGVSLVSAFAGRVTGDDAMNPDDTSGLASEDAVSDWTSFAGPFRHWARESTTFPGMASWGTCSEGTCRIWDWALAADDTVARGALPAPDGKATLSHAWNAGGVSVFLPNAAEVTGDGDGDEDLLCEAGETCRVTSNLASDQEADTPMAAMDMDGDAAVTGVTLLGPPGG